MSAAATAPHTTFIIRPHRGGWQCSEGCGVQPYFVGENARAKANSYAQSRTAHRAGEIRVLDAAGELPETISYDERLKPM